MQQRRQVARLRARLDEQGIPHLPNPSHIIPVMVKDPVKCRISDILMSRSRHLRAADQLSDRAQGHRAAALHARAAAHRRGHRDQLAVIEPATDADVRLRFWNADGSTAGACGNATRCIARHLMAAAGTDRLTLRTDHTAIAARDLGGGQTAVNLGAPVFDWQAIPLARAADVTALPIPGAPAALSMGNPHCVFRVDDLAAVDIHEMGPAHETHPLFPERTNVEAVQVLGRDRIRILIWERGTGATLASGRLARRPGSG
jgi:diaminopimelate epimerase